MTQSDLNRAVAHATGETVTTIRELGFVPLMPIPYEHEADVREPLAIDWDEPGHDLARPVPELVAL
ncbi:MAG: hypothetical protein DWQ34_23930 [Planctomycetota bacterium]|nr:MAG: hypothetical protein DWQ29_17890 [Planctomycetota bacterium]REJ87702.1 MAG: hypothetical protein DWQ34_23930 [Planctomycetota bacterium]REK28164.1 MAG: hypothetical protein DWQ41_06220 [Planctomycetota bacterium]REK34411.1 MAG: hypothetical protein DWQ45_13235 [Planctomycetota bacterium]